MIHPSSESLLTGVATALEEAVLPELARGTAARKQLQAALATLRRVAGSLGAEAETLAADNADMEAVLAQIESEFPGMVPPDPVRENLSLQQIIVGIQDRLNDLPANYRTRISQLLTDLHKRTTDRAAAMMSPPKSKP